MALRAAALRAAAGAWWGRFPESVRDVSVAAVVAALDLVLFSELLLSSTVTQDRSSAAAMIVAALANLAVLTVRRRFPLPALVALCALSAVVALALTYRPILPVCIALGTVTSRGRAKAAAAGLALAVATTASWVIDEVQTSPEVDSTSVAVFLGIAYTLVVVVAAGIGRWARTARERLRLMDERRRLEALQAVEAERLRLARELHDIVSHAVTIMVLQASGARRIMGRDRARAESALTTVEEVGGRAMNELRRLLGVLRTDDGNREPPDTANLPGVGDLPRLVGDLRASGLDVAFDEAGDERRLDASVGLAAYRVVQEALTNVGKHAGAGARASVTLQWTADTVVVAVSDDGGGPGIERPTLSTGHGLLGLRERVSVAGGTLRTGPTAGGFSVTAVLPVADPASCPAAPEVTGLP